MSGAVKSGLHVNKTGTRYWALDRERMSLLCKEVVASRKFRDDAKTHFAKKKEGEKRKILLEQAITGYSCTYSRRLLI